MQDAIGAHPSLDSIELRPIASVKIALSDARQVGETSAFERVELVREDEPISELEIYAEPPTVDQRRRGSPSSRSLRAYHCRSDAMPRHRRH